MARVLYLITSSGVGGSELALWQLLRRLDREARAASALSHPNIVQIYDVGVAAGQAGEHYVVMECVEGETLRRRLARGPLPIPELLDLGAWWKDETGLPLPLGGNAVRRDLGPEMMARLTRLVRETVSHSRAHRPQALEYAMTFARGMDPKVADQFVGMWVNDMTVDMGERGKQAVQTFLDRGFEAGIIPKRVAVDFVEA